MRLLITGVSGFSGSHLARHLLAQGHEVVAVSRRPRGMAAIDLRSVAALSWIESDLTELSEWPLGVEAVIHAAASSPGPHMTVEKMIHDNVQASQHLFTLAREAGVAKVIFFSSLSLYGTIREAVVEETTGVLEPDAYGATKLLAEFWLRENAAQLPSIALRLPAVLGAGASRHWLAGLLQRARSGAPITIFNPTARFNNAVHVRDLVRLVERLLAQSWDGFDAATLGAAGGLTIGEIASRVVERTASRSEIRVDPAPQASFTVSSRHACLAYGYRPMDFEAMLELYLHETKGC